MLMCAPRYTPPLTSENSWLPDAPPFDPGLALEQWERLRSLVETHIGPVQELQPEPWAPAMTFTRDLALVCDNVVIPFMPGSFRGPFEAPLAHRRLADLGLPLRVGNQPLRFDGGNVLADSHDRLLLGMTSADPGAEIMEVVDFFKQHTERTVFRVPLAGGRFPHIDMALCDLGTAWLAYPDALPGFDLTDDAWRSLFGDKPVIQVAPTDGERLACNLVVSTCTGQDTVAIGHDVSLDLRRELQSHGINFVPTPLTELVKAGGSAHCLTLDLPAEVS